MPHYPSNFNNPSSETTVNNVTSFIEFKDLNNNSNVVGEYPTNDGYGETTLVNPTQQIPDILSITATLGTQLTALTTAINALSSGQQSYACAMYNLKLNHLQDASLQLTKHVSHMVTKMNTIAVNGVPTTNIYPSDQHRGF